MPNFDRSSRPTFGWWPIAILLFLAPLANSQRQLLRQQSTTASTFEPNKGQAPSWAHYLVRTAEGKVLLGGDRIEIQKPGKTGIATFDLVLHSSRPHSFQELERLPGVANYYIGGNQLTRVEGVPLFQKVRYIEAYPGVNLLFHDNHGRLEYDFELAPRASLDDLRIDLTEDEVPIQQNNGSLVIEKAGQKIQLLEPAASQSVNGKKVPVEVQYRLLDKHTIGFQLTDYDPDSPLTVDPVVSYASLIPATNSQIVAAAANSSGELYVTGWKSNFEVSLIKFDAAGQKMIYSTYIQDVQISVYGSMSTALAIDTTGNAYIVGTTTDPFFPVTSHKISPPTTVGAFVTKFDSTGVMQYSTVIGAGLTPSSITVDQDGNAYIAGIADINGASLQTVNAYQAANMGSGSIYNNGGSAFFVKLNSAGNGYIFSSFLGAGIGSVGLARDTGGNIYIGGAISASGVSYGTILTNAKIPLKGELIASPGPLFLTKFAPDGKTLLFGSFLGGLFPDTAYGDNRPANLVNLSVGADGTVYMGGNMSIGVDYPYTLGAYQYSVKPTYSLMFAMAIEPSLSLLKYATDLGAGVMTGMAVDSTGNLYAAGNAGGLLMNPFGGPIQPINAVVADETQSGFFLELNASGNPVQSSAFGGRTFSQVPNAMAIDNNGSIYLAGLVGRIPSNPFVDDCYQGDLIVVGPDQLADFQQILSQYENNCGHEIPKDLFIAKIAPESKPQISVGQYLPYVYLHNVGSADLQISNISYSNGLTKVGGTCGNTVAAGSTCILTVAQSSGYPASGTITIASNATPSVQTFQFAVSSPFAGAALTDYLYADTAQLVFPPQLKGTQSAPKPMRVWNAGIADLTINSISGTGDLIQTNDCAAVLKPSAGCTVQVSYASSTDYYGDGAVTIAYDGKSLTTNSHFPLRSSLTQLITSLNYSNLFGSETQGNPYLHHTYAITNVGTTDINPPQIAVNGDTAFVIAGNTCTSSLAPQQSCKVAIALDSSAVVGAHTASLVLSGSQNKSYNLSGQIIAPLKLVASASQLEWDPILIGTTSTESMTLTNSGSSPVSISGFTITDLEFTETDNCLAGPLAAGASCTMQISFTPQNPGTRSGMLTVNSGNSVNPLTVSLTGTGNYALRLSPAYLDFGNSNYVNAISAPQNVTMTNLTSSSIPYTLTVTGHFVANNQCANPLPANASCTISVTFNPSTGNECCIAQETLTVMIAGSSVSNSVALSGASVIAPGITITPYSTSGVGDGSAVSTPQGAAANYSVKVLGIGGFSGVASLSCSGFPQYSSCTVTPSSVNLALGTAYSQVQIITYSLASSASLRQNNLGKKLGVLALCSLIPWFKRKKIVSWFALLILISIGISACGGGSSQPVSPTYNYSSPGTYKVTVTASSGSVTNSVQLTLTVVPK
jgi:hypothetical protein